MTNNENTRTSSVIAAMSGGVDSTSCAILLKNAGYDVTGVTCKMFGSKVASDDELDAMFMTSVDEAKAACRQLGIPHYTFNCKTPFERCVIDDFVDAYLSGRTPNPCVACNKHVKFGALHKRRAEMGADILATGHYARIEHDELTGRWKLLRGKDAAKDQSYMLHSMTQDQLAHTLFPLGDLTKDEVRSLAAEAGMRNADNPESQDICFVPDGDYLRFVRNWVREQRGGDDGSQPTPAALLPGSILDMDGRVIGEHDGVAGYTIGQRRGLGIAAPSPLYVVDKDAESNSLIVGSYEALLRNEIAATDVNLVSADEEDLERGELRVLAKTSYRQAPRPATAHLSDSTLHIAFDEPLVRPAPGQALVIYDAATGEEVLAGGTIC